MPSLESWAIKAPNSMGISVRYWVLTDICKIHALESGQKSQIDAALILKHEILFSACYSCANTVRLFFLLQNNNSFRMGSGTGWALHDAKTIMVSLSVFLSMVKIRKSLFLQN